MLGQECQSNVLSATNELIRALDKADINNLKVKAFADLYS